MSQCITSPMNLSDTTYYFDQNSFNKNSINPDDLIEEAINILRNCGAVKIYEQASHRHYYLIIANFDDFVITCSLYRDLYGTLLEVSAGYDIDIASSKTITLCKKEWKVPSDESLLKISDRLCEINSKLQTQFPNLNVKISD